MTCEDFRDRVDEYLEGLLPPEEAARRHSHAGACDTCARELEEAQAFAELMAGEGRAALGAFESRRFTRRVLAGAKTGELPKVEEQPVVQLVPKKPWPARLLRPLAAAAVVVAAVLVYGLRPSGPTVLAAGQPTTLTAGSRATFGTASELQVDRPTRVTALEDQAGDRVRIETGSAFFFSGVRLAVESQRGVTTGSGVTFHLSQDENGTARIAVLSGDVAHEGGEGEERQELHAGDLVEIDAQGRSTVVNNASIGELRVMAGMGQMEMSSLRGELTRLQEELAELRRERAERDAGRDSVSEDALDELPWDELGKAARALLLRSAAGNLDDPRRNRALAVFLLHSEEIRAATGVGRSKDGLWHPAAIDRMASSFFEALAPEADAAALAEATRATQAAARKAMLRLREGAMPSERLQDRLFLFRTMIESTRKYLGDTRAAELAAGIRGASQLTYGHRMRFDGTLVDDLVAMRGKRFNLVDAQRDALVPVVEEYVAETARIQADITELLGEEDARRILFPRRPPWRPGPARPRPPRGELTDAERVDDAIRVIDSMSDLLDARVEFEYGLWDILRPDQRTAGLLTGNYVLTFEGTAR